MKFHGPPKPVKSIVTSSPELVPKQYDPLTPVIVAVGAPGNTIFTGTTFEIHPLASVKETLKVPAPKPVISGFVTTIS